MNYEVEALAFIMKSRKAKQRRRGPHCLEHRLRIQGGQEHATLEAERR